MFKKKYLVIALLAISVTFLVGVASGFEISTFNPIGRHLFDPIERAIPGLTLKGFMENETDLDLHMRSKPYDFQKIEWLFELRAEYEFTPKARFTVIGNYLYDGEFDWDYGFSHLAEKKLERYRELKQILREAYLDYDWGKWVFRIGKQQVVWGKIDGRKILDIVNPEDSREGFDASMDDWEYTRIPLWMANLNYFRGDYSLQLLWIPDFEPTLSAPAGYLWAFPSPPASPVVRVVRRSPDEPEEHFFKDHQFGGRFGFIKNGWDVHLCYLYSSSYIPTFFTESVVRPPGRPTPFNPIVVTLAPQHTRIHRAGFALDKQLTLPGEKALVIRVENVWTINGYLGNNDLRDLDAQTQRDNVLTAYAVSYDFFVDWTNTLTLTHQHYIGDDKDLTVLPIKERLDKDEFTFSWSLRKLFYNDRLTLALLFLFNEAGNWRWRPQLFYALSDFITLQIGGHFFYGDRKDLIGQFRNNDEIEFGIKYTF